ncbi:hypothetical protein FA95DRAFT_1563622 [Auriscalpium vulgare]|uniref:Uncharacterized protein n=1 Tax=Auriscalpium vulgare TaxID=40419 RepID=A0ACB8RGB8_9AGAM|nr:hypothetical protein FA95DRAFT_1563622 [Auriscalpium vulgare]
MLTLQDITYVPPPHPEWLQTWYRNEPEEVGREHAKRRAYSSFGNVWATRVEVPGKSRKYRARRKVTKSQKT